MVFPLMLTNDDGGWLVSPYLSPVYPLHFVVTTNWLGLH